MCVLYWFRFLYKLSNREDSTFWIKTRVKYYIYLIYKLTNICLNVILARQSIKIIFQRLDFKFKKWLLLHVTFGFLFLVYLFNFYIFKLSFILRYVILLLLVGVFFFFSFINGATNDWLMVSFNGCKHLLGYFMPTLLEFLQLKAFQLTIPI